jgi:uncharacterized protein DUF6252
MRRIASLLFATAVVSLSGCGSSDSTGISGGTGGVFSASVGGVAWTASGPLANITATGVNITGQDAAKTITVTVTFIASAPGTYSLTFSQSTGGVATVAKSNGQAYSTVATGGTGSVTVTTLTAHHAVGTFSFDAIGSGPADILHVTNGKFDITI